jgi:broad-specificity NMP kinase
MKKCEEVIEMWEEECEKPFNYVFNIQINREDFNEMVEEIKVIIRENNQLKEKVDKYEKALINTYVDGMSIDEILMASEYIDIKENNEL